MMKNKTYKNKTYKNKTTKNKTTKNNTLKNKIINKKAKFIQNILKEWIKQTNGLIFNLLQNIKRPRKGQSQKSTKAIQKFY